MLEEKPKLLLLTCCGPCATACVERTAFDYDVTVFYYNPNITDGEEYYLRKENLEKFLRLFGEEYKDQTTVHYLEGRYDPERYLERTAMLQNEPEGSHRCEVCFTLRYEEAARVAKELKMDYWTSTMSVSPHKNFKLLTEIGERLAAETDTCYLPIDFKKKNGFGRSVELSKKYGLYRQRFCGCEFARYWNEEKYGTRRRKMANVIIPKDYEPKLGLKETQRAIKKIKDYFQQELAYGLQLRRVSAPLFVFPETGYNDTLNGVERRVEFTIKDMDERKVEIVQSLAKWKRMALHKYDVEPGHGIYTDMNAIRRDEELDNLHSIYVDQWDWEKVITADQRTTEYLEETVRTIYNALKNLGDYVNRLYRDIQIELPNEITFIDSQELEDLYPGKSPKEREDLITKEHGAVFIKRIGGLLASGEKHDGRAPDYDDWELNGDILVWNDVLDRAFEISSMGIRVDAESMKRQLKIDGKLDRLEQPFHQGVMTGKYPLTIGGGIGQSRLCMFFLQKAHIGEVQVSVWPDAMIDECAENNIFLL